MLHTLLKVRQRLGLEKPGGKEAPFWGGKGNQRSFIQLLSALDTRNWVSVAFGFRSPTFEEGSSKPNRLPDLGLSEPNLRFKPGAQEEGWEPCSS